MSWLQHRIERLEAENADLRDLLALLKGEREYVFPAEWKLSPKQHEMLALLAKRGEVSHRAMFDALYWNKADPPESNVISVQIHEIRKKTPAECVIENVSHFGYRLPPSTRLLLSRFRVEIDEGEAA